MPRRLGSGLRGHAPELRRERRGLAGDVLAPRRRVRVQGGAQRLMDGELRPARSVGRGEHPREPAVGGLRQVLLRPRVALGHRQSELGDRGRAGELPVRARLSGGLGSHVPALVARGPRRRRHLHLRDHGTACRLVRDEGRDQRGLGRELRPGWRSQRLQRPVQRPRRQHEGDLQLRRGIPCADGDRRDAGRRAGLAGHPVALRPGAQGLPRHRPQLDFEGLVHGRERRPQRRLLPDDRQHERRDAPVRRHGRIDVHRPPDARHDLRRRGGSGDGRHGLQGDREGQERQVHDRDGVPHRSGPQHGDPERQARAQAGLPALRSPRPDGERQRWRRRWQRRRGLGDGRPDGGAPGARRLRPDHGDERGQPRLRPARVCRPRRRPDRGDERLRRLGERRARAARRGARPHPVG